MLHFATHRPTRPSTVMSLIDHFRVGVSTPLKLHDSLGESISHVRIPVLEDPVFVPSSSRDPLRVATLPGPRVPISRFSMGESFVGPRVAYFQKPRGKWRIIRALRGSTPFPFTVVELNCCDAYVIMTCFLGATGVTVGDLRVRFTITCVGHARKHEYVPLELPQRMVPRDEDYGVCAPVVSKRKTYRMNPALRLGSPGVVHCVFMLNHFKKHCMNNPIYQVQVTVGVPLRARCEAGFFFKKTNRKETSRPAHHYEIVDGGTTRATRFRFNLTKYKALAMLTILNALIITEVGSYTRVMEDLNNRLCGLVRYLTLMPPYVQPDRWAVVQRQRAVCIRAKADTLRFHTQHMRRIRRFRNLVRLVFKNQFCW